MLGQQVLKVEIADILGIVNIVDIADVVDIGTDIADIGIDIADIVMGITDIVDSANIVNWILRTLRWKRVDMYKVSPGCPITVPPFKLELLQDGVMVILDRVYESLLQLI